MDEFMIFIYIVGGILSVILFFKVWGMTNDIRKIRRKYVDSTNIADLKHVVKDGDGQDSSDRFWLILITVIILILCGLMIAYFQ
jgi:hypothetical protein